MLGGALRRERNALPSEERNILIVCAAEATEMAGVWYMWCTRTGWEGWDCSAWRGTAVRSPAAVYNYLVRGNKQEQARLFSLLDSKRQWMQAGTWATPVSQQVSRVWVRSPEGPSNLQNAVVLKLSPPTMEEQTIFFVLQVLLGKAKESTWKWSWISIWLHGFQGEPARNA